MLCDSCNAFNIQRFAQDPTNTQGYRLQDAEVASLLGCEFCELLIGIVRHQISEAKSRYGSDVWIHLSMSEDYKIRLQSPTTSTTPRFSKLEIILAPRSFQATNRPIETYFLPSHDLCVAADPESHAARNGDVLGRYLGDHPDSDFHFAAMKQWLTECMRHPGCRRTISQVDVVDGDVKLPTRCIDVMGVAPSLRPTAGQRGAYTTLSHRWDRDTETSKTTLENLEQRTCAIHMDSLPTTFRHAVYITRRMGIRYLWIDSVCIIQDGDDGADWMNEAHCMAEYYQLSSFTIAATASSDGRGCLFQRTPIIPGNLVELPYRDSNRNQRGYFYVYYRERSLIDEYKRSVLESPLLQRGWVFQEWVLSRRVIYFTDAQIYFECRSRYPRNECQETLPIDLGTVGLLKRASKIPLKKHFFVPPGTSWKREDVWYRIVEHFSSLQLTLPAKDRLLALAGLGSGLQHLLLASSAGSERTNPIGSREYVSGLWVQDIHRGLLWQHSKEGPAIKSGCNTPSWSWATYSTPVTWNSRKRAVKNVCELMSVHTGSNQSGGADRFEHTAQEQSDTLSATPHCDDFESSNTFTVLRMKGPLKKIMIGHILSCEKEECARKWTEYEGVIYENNWSAVSDSKAPALTIGWADIERPGFQDQPSTSEGTCMHALHTTSYRAGTWLSRYNICEVLFLRKVGDNLYERLGVGRIWKEKFFADADYEELYLQ